MLVRIKNLYDSGHETEQADKILRNEFATITDQEESKEKEENLPTLATAEGIKEIKEALTQQQDFNKRLLAKLDQQEKHIKESIEKRDRQLMETLNTMQEEKEPATSNENPSFFKRLFGGKSRY